MPDFSMPWWMGVLATLRDGVPTLVGVAVLALVVAWIIDTVQKLAR